jgi:hypothetical protein
MKLITVKNKTSIKIHLQTATPTIQETFHPHKAALKPLQNTQNTITLSTKTHAMIHNHSKVETSARAPTARDTSLTIKTFIQRMDKNFKHQDPQSNSDHRTNITTSTSKKI